MVEMYLTPMTFRRKDNMEFDIEVKRTTHDAKEVYAVFVTYGSTLLNNPRSQFYAGSDEAYQAGLVFAKGYKLCDTK